MIRMLVFTSTMALAGVVVPVWGHGSDNVAKVAHALAADQPLVLALVTRFPDPATSGETYADWSARLNGFARKHPHVTVVALDRAQAGQILAVVPELDRHYATLFVRDDGKAVIYDGAIVEKLVYAVALRYLESPDVSVSLDVFQPVSVHFTPQVKARVKALRHRHCKETRRTDAVAGTEANLRQPHQP